MADQPELKVPMFEILKSIPAAVGIRLDEEPPYTVLEKKGDVEVRSYNKILVAQVEVPGAHSTSAGDGFRKLASYIFGGNTEKANMAMTIPVLQEQTQKTGNESWRSTFVLPAKYTMDTVPKPQSGDVQVKYLPERFVAALHYTGENSEENMAKAKAELLAGLAKTGYLAVGEVHWAQYDQPFTIPFLKRNEALVEVVKA